MFITRIYFRIQIKFSKQSVGSLFTGAAILTSIAVQQISIDIFQFGLDVFKHLCSGVTRRKETTHRIVFCYERDIAEKIECMIIGQSTDKASFSTVMADVCLFAFSELGNLIITRIAQEFVTQSDSIIDTVIHIRYPGIISIPGQISKITYLITFKPGRCQFIGATLLQIEIATHIILTVITTEISIATAFFLSGSNKRNIEFA